jgi:hypothetical protein
MGNNLLLGNINRKVIKFPLTNLPYFEKLPIPSEEFVERDANTL